MSDDLDYGSEHTDRQTFAAMGVLGVLLALALWLMDFQVKINQSAASLMEFSTPAPLVFSWRVVAACLGLWAVVSMFRVGPGNMQALLHKERTVKLIHPVGFEKFVTFSSWTLLSNILYFLSVIAGSMYGSATPGWLETAQIVMFVIACGSAFLTATVVRYIILPGFVDQARDSQYMFQYHEQVMHNFAAMFLAIEVVLVGPIMHPQFALYCVGMGLVYVCFAYTMAYKFGGYYVYSFIDPRLRNAPFVMIALAFAIGLFYLGIYLASLIVAWNQLAGALVLLIWVALIVQFWSNDPATQSSS